MENENAVLEGENPTSNEAEESQNNNTPVERKNSHFEDVEYAVTKICDGDVQASDLAVEFKKKGYSDDEIAAIFNDVANEIKLKTKQNYAEAGRARLGIGIVTLLIGGA